MRPTLAVIIPVGEGPIDPGFGNIGGIIGGRPDQGLPPIYHPGHPDHGLPSRPDHPWWGGGRPDHPDQGLPGGGGHPGNRPPGSGGPDRPGHDLPWAPGHPGNRPPGSYPGRPDQGLPGGGGPVDPGWGGGWGGGDHPSNRPPGSWGGRPDQGLPGEQPGIDNSLPGGWGRPDQGLPGPQPKAYSAAIPPKPPETVNTEEGVWVIVNVNGTLAWAWAQKPESQPGIDNSLPGGKPPTPGQELPETPEPK